MKISDEYSDTQRVSSHVEGNCICLSSEQCVLWVVDKNCSAGNNNNRWVQFPAWCELSVWTETLSISKALRKIEITKSSTSITRQILTTYFTYTCIGQGEFNHEETMCCVQVKMDQRHLFASLHVKMVSLCWENAYQIRKHEALCQIICVKRQSLHILPVVQTRFIFIGPSWNCRLDLLQLCRYIWNQE